MSGPAIASPLVFFADHWHLLQACHCQNRKFFFFKFGKGRRKGRENKNDAHKALSGSGREMVVHISKPTYLTYGLSSKHQHAYPNEGRWAYRKT